MQIQQIRSFNRIVSQRAGTLEQSYLGQGRPLGVARLLFEIGQGPADVREIRERLSLDSGYMSRLLRALEREGLIRTSASTEDRRVKALNLTERGQAEVATYDRLSDELAQSMLDPLEEPQRQKLVEAMAEVEKLLRAAMVRLETQSPDSPQARACVDLYFRELNQRFDTGYDPDTAGPLDMRDFLPPNGVFVVASLGGRAIGCGGLTRVDERTGEIKRLWISHNARGMGLGRRLLRHLETMAVEMGFTRICLDTNASLTEAQTLYRTQGYAEIAPYNDNPYANHWFAKVLQTNLNSH